MKSLIAYFVKRGVVVNLTSTTLLLGAISAATQMQREAFPSINFVVIDVSGAYRGAAPR